MCINLTSRVEVLEGRESVRHSEDDLRKDRLDWVCGGSEVGWQREEVIS